MEPFAVAERFEFRSTGLVRKLRCLLSLRQTFSMAGAAQKNIACSLGNNLNFMKHATTSRGRERKERDLHK